MIKNLFLIVLSLAIGCSTTEMDKKSENIISGTGTIKFIDLEGGFYGIIGDDEQKLLPDNLNEEFQVDGLRVRYEAKVQEDVMTIKMWGKPVEIIKIEKVE
jgi:hypothetical protein